MWQRLCVWACLLCPASAGDSESSVMRDLRSMEHAANSAQSMVGRFAASMFRRILKPAEQGDLLDLQHQLTASIAAERFEEADVLRELLMQLRVKGVGGKLEELHGKMHTAVSSEDFVEAAKLRDKLDDERKRLWLSDGTGNVSVCSTEASPGKGKTLTDRKPKKKRKIQSDTQWLDSKDICMGILFQDKTVEALECFQRVHMRDRDPFGKGSPMDTKDIDNAQNATCILKLRHDAEMYRWLHKHDMLPEEFHAAPDYYSKLLDSAEKVYVGKPLMSFTGGFVNDELWRKTHQRAVLWGSGGSAEKLPEGVLNPQFFKAKQGHHAVRAAEVEAAYHANRNRSLETTCGSQNGWAVVDNLLQPKALKQILHFLTSSTMYYTSKHGGRYLAAFLNEGLSSPVILQLVEELRKAFPSVFKGSFLRNGWAFKYDNTLAPEEVGSDENADVESALANGRQKEWAPDGQHGVPIHADQGAVNVNIWLVDVDDGDKKHAKAHDEHGGGMVVYQAAAEKDYGGYNHAAFDKEIIGQCRESRKDVIKYKSNRMVMFNSDLYHATMPMRFPRGYSKRRINLTLIFGNKCGQMPGWKKF